MENYILQQNISKLEFSSHFLPTLAVCDFFSFCGVFSTTDLKLALLSSIFFCYVLWWFYPSLAYILSITGVLMMLAVTFDRVTD